MCSGFNFCDRNVYFTEMIRTQLTDDFVETVEQSVQKLMGSFIRKRYKAYCDFSKFSSHNNSRELTALLSHYAFPHSEP